MTGRFPAVGTILAIHEILIAETGGAPGLRDIGALESAIMRPKIGYYDGIIEEAAALMESLAINHPFLDGNKRIAFAAADTFLLMNGHFIDCDSIEAHSHFMSLFETNSFRFAELVAWLSDKVKPLPADWTL